MPYDGAGNYTRIYSWQADRDLDIKIQAARMDEEMNDRAAALNQVMLRSGVTPMGGNLDLSGNRIVGLVNGLATAPAIQFDNDTGTGVYLNGTNRFAVATNSTKRLEVNNTGVEVAGALTVSGNINGNLVGNVTGNVTGNVSGNAANVTGIVAVANGGTGASTAAGARTNLGATSVGISVFTAVDAAAARLAIGAGTVTSVNGTGSVNGLTLSGSVSGSGSLVLSGAVTSVDSNALVNSRLIGYRNAPPSSITSGTLTLDDVGEVVSATGGVTAPSGVFSQGDIVNVYNNSAAAITITQGAGLTLRLDATTTTGNRTLAARGMCAIWFNSGTEAIIIGKGVT